MTYRHQVVEMDYLLLIQMLDLLTSWESGKTNKTIKHEQQNNKIYAGGGKTGRLGNVMYKVK